MRPIHNAALSLLVFASAASTTFAATAVETFSWADRPVPTANMQATTIRPFNAALGRLTGVNIDLTGGAVVATLRVVNEGAVSSILTPHLVGDHHVAINGVDIVNPINASSLGVTVAGGATASLRPVSASLSGNQPAGLGGWSAGVIPVFIRFAGFSGVTVDPQTQFLADPAITSSGVGTVTYTYEPAPPEIGVEQAAGTDLVDGAATVSFGSLIQGITADRVFTIRNTGGADLTGLGITIDGADAARFSVTANPTAPVSGPGGSTTFTVRFAPTSPGARTAVLHLTSNDADESPFDITLTGAGLGPEIGLVGRDSLEIADGDITPNVADGTDFGSSLATDAPVERVFLITSSGTAALRLTGITVTGPDAGAFTVRGLSLPVTIPSPGLGNFVVTFAPTTPGTRTATITVLNDDSDESPYTFDIQATRLNSPPVARDDVFTVPAGSPVVIPVSALLANDSDPDGAVPSLVAQDANTTQGGAVTPVGSPVTAFTLPAMAALPAGVTEDTFTYRISDGTLEATGTVRLRILPGLLVYEGFEYPAGEHLATPSLTEPARNGGVGWAGPWTTDKSFPVFPINPSSLTPPVTDFPTSGGAVGNAGSAGRQIPPIMTAAGQSLWFSAVLRSAASISSQVILEFGFDNSYGLRLTHGSRTGNPPQQWKMDAYDTAFGPDAMPDQPTLLVAELRRTAEPDYNYEFRFHVNPTAAEAPGSPPAFSVTGRGYGFHTLRSVLLTTGTEPERAGFDEIRIGRSYESVTLRNPFLVASLNEIRVVHDPAVGGSYTLPFSAPAAGTYVLERQLMACHPGDPTPPWLPIARTTVAGSGTISFVDGLTPCGAIYRVRSVP